MKLVRATVEGVPVQRPASSVLASSFSSLAMSQVWSPAALAATLVPSTA